MSKNSKQLEVTVTFKKSQQSQIETVTMKNSKIVSYNALESEKCKSKEETFTYNQEVSGRVS